LDIINNKESLGETMKMNTLPNGKSELILKTEELKNSLLSLSQGLPKTQFLRISDGLKQTAMDMPYKIEDLFKKDRKIDYIRSFIKVSSSLEECKVYLNLVQKLKFGDTKDLIDMIEDINYQISQGYSRYLTNVEDAN